MSPPLTTKTRAFCRYCRKKGHMILACPKLLAKNNRKQPTPKQDQHSENQNKTFGKSQGVRVRVRTCARVPVRDRVWWRQQGGGPLPANIQSLPPPPSGFKCQSAWSEREVWRPPPSQKPVFRGVREVRRKAGGKFEGFGGEEESAVGEEVRKYQASNAPCVSGFAPPPKKNVSISALSNISYLQPAANSSDL